MRPTELLAFLSGQDLMIVGVLILVLFGGAKIPQLMRGLGRGMGEFKAGLAEGKEAMSESMRDIEHTSPSRAIDDHTAHKAVDVEAVHVEAEPVHQEPTAKQQP